MRNFAHEICFASLFYFFLLSLGVLMSTVHYIPQDVPRGPDLLLLLELPAVHQENIILLDVILPLTVPLTQEYVFVWNVIHSTPRKLSCFTGAVLALKCTRTKNCIALFPVCSKYFLAT